MIAALLLLMAAPPRLPARPPAGHREPVTMPMAGAGGVMVGGYAAVSRADPGVHRSFRAAVAAITPAKHPGAHLVAAETQVVAGTNYRLTLKLRDGSRWQATVWHRLDGQYEVTGTTRLD